MFPPFQTSFQVSLLHGLRTGVEGWEEVFEGNSEVYFYSDIMRMYIDYFSHLLV